MGKSPWVSKLLISVSSVGESGLIRNIDTVFEIVLTAKRNYIDISLIVFEAN